VKTDSRITIKIKLNPYIVIVTLHWFAIVIKYELGPIPGDDPRAVPSQSEKTNKQTNPYKQKPTSTKKTNKIQINKKNSKMFG
jgi:hypothetical protein